MSEALIIALVQGLVSGLPKLIAAIRAGRDISSLQLGEFISEDALAAVNAASVRADDFIENG